MNIPIIAFGSFIVLFIYIIYISIKTSDSKRVSRKVDTIPEKYISFPAYNGKLSAKPEEVLTDKYERLTLFYEGEPKEEYLDSLYMLGYEKVSSVRFDKNNTYVIFEKIGKNTKIAYHIKKYN